MSDFAVGDRITNGIRYYIIQSITDDGYELVRTNNLGAPILNKNNKVDDVFTVESIPQDMPGYEKVTSGGRRTHKRSKKSRKSRKTKRRHH